MLSMYYTLKTKRWVSPTRQSWGCARALHVLSSRAATLTGTRILNVGAVPTVVRTAVYCPAFKVKSA